MIDLTELRAAALAATVDVGDYFTLSAASARYIVKANPETVLALIARLEAAEALLQCRSCGMRPSDEGWVWCQKGGGYDDGHVMGGPEPYPCGPVIIVAAYDALGLSPGVTGAGGSSGS